ncbi:MAG: aldehyde dehydrogenase family protein, partial [Anaerolineales bacterium]|nr:aldehyde dehydrogenase family protein [Anaerolineales bacterium]
MAQMFIGDGWADAQSGKTYPVKNPATGELIDHVPFGEAADANAAVEAALAAFPGWADTAADERANLLRKGLALVEENGREIVDLLTSEQGKPQFEAQVELHHFLHGMEFYAGLASKIRGAQVPVPPAMGKHNYGMIFKRPVGVAVGIVPWNFPLTLTGTKIGPALIAGCPLIIKPSESTPLATLKVIGLLNDAGLPPGVLQCVTGFGPEAGEPLVTHPGVRRVALTGSSETGRRVMELAGPQFKRVTLELGGSDPMIVCPDADLRKAVSGATIGRYWNAGQACLAVKRLYIFDEIYDEFTYEDARENGKCPSPARFTDRMILVRGFGKTYGCTGWRMGYAAGPHPIIQAMAKLQQYTFVCAPSMAQAGCVTAFDVDMSGHVEAYRRKRDMVLEGLRDVARIVEPGGAFYAFVEVS